VPAKSNNKGIVGAVKKSPGKVDSQLFPSLNHLFQSAKTGATDEYSGIDETINVGALNVISTWLNKNF
jgi:hypothetical protein